MSNEYEPIGVIGCWDCPHAHFLRDARGDRRAICMHPAHQFYDIEEMRGFPDWCQLEYVRDQKPASSIQ